MTETVIQERPRLLAKGRFALYESADGGAVLSYRPDGADEDSHQPIPAPMWRIMRAVMNGEQVDMGSILKAMIGR